MSTAVAMAGINEIIGEQILHSRWSLQGRRAGVFVVSSWTEFWRSGAVKLEKVWMNGKESRMKCPNCCSYKTQRCGLR